jgi:hypothetical protein
MSDVYDPDPGEVEDDEPIEDLDEDEEPPEDEEPVEETEEEEPPRAAQPARKPFRERVEEVATRVANERTASLEAELRALKAERDQPARETQTQRNERLSQMEPWERTEFLTNERLAAIEWNANERADKAAFAMTCMSDPVASKLKDEVERELADLRARGQNVDRDTMLTFILGRRARANSGRAAGRAQKTATANRDRQTARPGNARADVAPSNPRAGTAAARNKRLENLNI